MIQGTRSRYFFLFAGLLALAVVALLFTVGVNDKDAHRNRRLSQKKPRLLQANSGYAIPKNATEVMREEGKKDMGGDAWGLEEEGKAKHCRHGVWDAHDKICKCYDGWATASVTDTIDFFEGVCEQYHCQTDSICQSVLEIPGATCPVKNWNCYCGWKYAFSNFGHGWETPRKEGGGECMGLMYTFSIWASELLEGFLKQAWRYFLVMAVLLLPFGRKRSYCDHHRPSMWRSVRACFQCPSPCTGECVANVEGQDLWYDNLAWTFYVLDLMAWLYVFFVTLYLVVLTIWSFVLWALVIIATIVVLIAAVCATCAEGMSGCSCDCCAGGTSGGCADCCFIGAAHGGGTADMSGTLLYTSGGPWPYDPFWGYSGYGHVSTDGDCECCGGCFSTLCRPIASLLFIFPVPPENMWGGFIGYRMGTHVNTDPTQVYTGGNSMIEFLRMGWRRTADLHEDLRWREQVFEFIVGTNDGRPGNNNNNGTLANGTPTGHYQGVQNPQDFELVFEGERRRGLSLSRGARAIYIERAFDLRQDNCVESSFDDYKKGECWICRSDNTEWDMWVSCHHIFCKECSTEMLHRKMPCPLCRVASSTVLRGKKFENRLPSVPPSNAPSNGTAESS